MKLPNREANKYWKVKFESEKWRMGAPMAKEPKTWGCFCRYQNWRRKQTKTRREESNSLEIDNKKRKKRKSPTRDGYLEM